MSCQIQTSRRKFMKRDAVTRQLYSGSLLMAMLLVPLAVPAWAQDKVPTLRSPAGAAGQKTTGEISAQVNGPLTCNLWNQPPSSVSTNAYANQDFTDFDAYDIFLADDFTNKVPWQIDTFFFPGGLWNGGTTLANAVSLHFQIYRDSGGKPDGDPKGGGNPPVWSLAVPPADSRITLESGIFGVGNVTLALESPLKLQPGTYWLIFYPQMEFTSYGQYGRNVADTANLSTAQVINPGGGFGYVPTSWGDATVLGMSQHDLAFCLQGKEGFPWPMFLPEITKEK
jgi:hypothetical protein